jgi:hypothetical protein
MPDAMIGVDLPLDFVDVRQLPGSNTTALANPADFATLASARTKLLANGTTAAQYASMTVNDVVYALRVLEEAAGIK